MSATFFLSIYRMAVDRSSVECIVSPSDRKSSAKQWFSRRIGLRPAKPRGDGLKTLGLPIRPDRRRTMAIINCSIHGFGECACTFYPVGARFTLGGEPIIGRQLRKDLTEAEKAEALRIGRIEFASAGAVRKR